MTLEGSYRGFNVVLHDPGIAVVTMDEPDRLNGQTPPMKRDMTEFFLEAQMDNSIRVVVVTGSGRAFSAGDDMTGRRRDYESKTKLAKSLSWDGSSEMGTYAGLRTISQQLNLAVRHLDKLTIAAVNGVAVQTGLSLALACDFRIAGSSARLGSATLRFGLQPDEGGHALVVELIGLARAMDFFMRKRILSAGEAKEYGLVHEVVPDDRLMDHTMDLARELAEGPQVAMRLLKRSLYNAAEMPTAQAFDDIAAKTAISDHHPDAAEGVASFREKREPKFNAWLKGRE
ncbi:MAG TPA: enoyl-CoA hydratase-related protein [Actinomycetota bacterium]|jgi:2-(1,2-epoxy-1,2-dihydrophenyl)acetyl-CoA isomerase|nr:enoyl-CoA hydratase-related protein [Actinomycetota bacterium]